MKLLITGAGGFIGKNLAEYFSGNPRYEIFAPRSAQLDLLDEQMVGQYLRKHHFDAVIHCAKVDGVYKKSATEYEVLDGNLRMFANLAKQSETYRKLIYMGSGAEYGRAAMKPLSAEEDIGSFIPKDPYGFSKFIMSQAATASGNIYELCLFGVYGKYEDYTRRFISNNLCRLIKGLPMTLRQNARFDYLYIDDLCRMLEQFLAIQPAYHIYNMCTGMPIELKTLAEMINRVTGANRELLVANEGMQREYSGCNKRLLRELGGFAFTPHEKAIAELYQYYRTIEEKIDPALI